LARTQNSLGSRTQLRLDKGLLGFDTQYQQRSDEDTNDSRFGAPDTGRDPRRPDSRSPRDWIDSLDDATHTRVVQAIDTLADLGPGLGRPLVDTIHGSSIANLKELRPGTVRILFAFDPWRDGILLVAGDKSGRWTQWYREAIPLAEQRYERYLKDRAEEEEEQR